ARTPGLPILVGRIPGRGVLRLQWPHPPRDPACPRGEPGVVAAGPRLPGSVRRPGPAAGRRLDDLLPRPPVPLRYLLPRLHGARRAGLAGDGLAGAETPSEGPG